MRLAHLKPEPLPQGILGDAASPLERDRVDQRSRAFGDADTNDDRHLGAVAIGASATTSGIHLDGGIAIRRYASSSAARSAFSVATANG